MSVRRSTPITISFAAINAESRPSRLSGIVWSTGMAKLSRDGGTFTNTTNLPSEIGATGVYSLSLTAAEMDAAWVMVLIESATPTFDAVYITIGTSANPTGTVVSDGGNTSSTFKTDRTESSNDHWKDSLLLFTSGALAGQVKKILAFNGTTKFVTLSDALTAAPGNGDRFVMVNS